ncbi:MAG: hypothetical protein M2R45_04227 [Verrucomicrobia subdivision 3 bacterium]|nr:hypothetical protein [Limisphaerales bacterium]MCS1417036.1 hypothetical protein [Limisphaerales bacterium]
MLLAAIGLSCVFCSAGRLPWKGPKRCLPIYSQYLTPHLGYRRPVKKRNWGRFSLTFDWPEGADEIVLLIPMIE